MSPTLVKSLGGPCLFLYCLLAFASPSPASTYYVRSDGGTSDQCTGLVDAPYPGSGANQPCAWSHPFWGLDKSGSWKIRGGDSIIIHSGSYRMGIDAPNTDWCWAGGSFDCHLPPLPSGPDPENPTRILGLGWDQGCSDPPELWGAERPWQIISLDGTSNAVIGCLELTDRSGCVEHHANPPVRCNRDTPPFGDWASNGIYAADSSNITLEHLNIHGFASAGIRAGRISDWTVEDVRIAGNGWVGWEGDIYGGDSNSGKLTFQNWLVEWNGCPESYPDQQPNNCWGQTAGGYGDGVGTGATGGHWIIEDSTFRYNTSDGLDLLYARSDSQIEIKRTKAYGNAGNQIKMNGPARIENCLMVGNCGYFDGKSFTYNVDNCRGAGSALALNLRKGNTVSVINSTIAGHGDCLGTVECDDSTCDGSENVIIQNNIFVGYEDFMSPGDTTCYLWFDKNNFYTTQIDYNVVHDTKIGAFGLSANDISQDPLLANSDLESFDGHLRKGSPAIDSGLSAGSLNGLVPNQDIEKVARPQGEGVDRGAYESGSPIIDHTCTDIGRVTEYWINKAKSEFRLSYGHTSHGSQIVTGMNLLKGASGSLYWFDHSGTNGGLSLHDYEPAGDLGSPDRTTWATRTRTLLEDPGNDRNLIMWSWCGQVSTATEADINTYLTLMNQLEQDYPHVTFIYMTGHLDGTGEDGNLHQRNNQIRNYCFANNKILLDFADIESYDPDGNYFLDRGADDGCYYSGGNWADEWCGANPGECESCSCAHSRCLNCQLKGKAFWWMIARLAGWSSSGAPITTTGSATLVTSASATLDGTVNPNGSSTVYYFQYGVTTSYGSTTASTSAGSGTSGVSVSAGVSGLNAATLYHYRIVATNSGGTTYGNDRTFTTSTLSNVIYINKDDGTCDGNSPCYTTTQAGIDAASNGSVLKVVQGTYNEDIDLSQPTQLTLYGGYDSSFTSQPGSTRTNSLTIADGMLIPSNLVLGPVSVGGRSQRAHQSIATGPTRVISLHSPRSGFYNVFPKYNPLPGTMEHRLLEFLKRSGFLAGYLCDYAFTPDAEHMESARNLIIHFYNTILGREPEPWGVDAWEQGYFNHALGFNIGVKYVASEMGRFFFNSEEYRNRERSDTEFMTDCYRAFLYRHPSNEKLKSWLPGGFNRAEALMTFANSDEFTNHIETLFAGFKGSPSRNFVTTMYIGLLDRLVMGEDLLYWSAQFENAGDKQETVKLLALEVIESEEFQDMEPSTTLMVIRLYHTFLGQFPTNEELAYWAGKLDSGTVAGDELIDRFGELRGSRGILKGFFPGHGQ